MVAKVADQKPPLVTGAERETVLALLQFQRESFARKFDGLSDADAQRVFVPSGTTLLWLLRHMADAEQLWVEQRFAGEPPAANDEAPNDRPNDRPNDDGHAVVRGLAAYRATWTRVNAIVASASLEGACRTGRGDTTTTLRWVLLHLLEETARHAGHADILRELVDGVTGR
jgi:uncharacterized damage-inducible protein DinB